MAGSALALVVLIVLPLAFLLWGTVTADGRLTAEHFRDAVSSRLYTQALRNSLVLGAATALLSVAAGLPLAWAVSRTNVPGKRFIHLTVIVSYLTPPFLTAIAFVNLFSPRAGLVNRFVRDVLGTPALTFDVFSMAGLILVTVPHTFPFVYLLTASALESVDASMEESAQILGASRWRTVAAVTGPLVAPAVLSGALVAFVNAIALFGSQAIVGLPGRVFTLPTRIYALFDYPPQYGLASALSLIFVGLTVAALYLQRSYLARRSYVTFGGKGSRTQLIELGTARWGLFAFCVAVFAVAVAAPYLTLLAVSVSRSWGLQFWQNLTLQHYRFVLFEYDVTRRAIWNSLILASSTATLAVLLGSLVGWIDLRTTLPGRKLLDYASLIPLGLPGIVVAVALIQFWLRVPLPDLRHAPDHPARVHRTLHPARGPLRECRFPPDRSLPGRDGAGHRRRLAAHVPKRHAAAGTARAFRGLAAGLRAGAPGAFRLGAPLQLGIHHAGRRRLQSLRDGGAGAGGGPGDRDHAAHHRGHPPGDPARSTRRSRRGGAARGGRRGQSMIDQIGVEIMQTLSS
jgi:iron(III) transport system permease protein